MTGSLVALRGKLTTAHQLGSIVRAMKAVAASSISQYEAALAALSDYERSVELGLSLCLGGSVGTAKTPRRCSAVGAVIFGSDQGMVGQFNSQLMDFTREALEKMAAPKVLWVIGEQIQALSQATDGSIRSRFPTPNSVAGISTLVGRILLEIEQYSTREPDAHIHVFHNRPTTPTTYVPTERQVLPLDQSWILRVRAARWPVGSLPELFGDPAPALHAFVREQMFIGLYQACTQSQASEHGCRLAAMQRAQDNIDRLSRKLNLSVNGLRQSLIDNELFDVLSGFDQLTRG
jgi:F-type H+-transporting ATPase subunit gamma